MKTTICTDCGSIALRMGTKGRAYCGAHVSKAWEQVQEAGVVWDARHKHDWDDRRLELHQDHLSRAV
jgi:hypothetical protein